MSGGGAGGKGDCLEDGKRRTGRRSNERANIARGRRVVGVQTRQLLLSHVHQRSAAGRRRPQTIDPLLQQSDIQPIHSVINRPIHSLQAI